MSEFLRRLEDTSSSALLPDSPIDVRHDRQASVLVILYTDKSDTVRVILTKRAAHLRHHPNEIALPGGRCDRILDRMVSDTAFRECQEEINMNKEDLCMVGRLPPLQSRHSNFLVHPIIATMKTTRTMPRKFEFDRQEVQLVFTMPLGKFLDTHWHTCHDDMEDGVDLHIVRHGPHRVMGMTCAVLIQTAMIVYNRVPSYHFTYPHYDDTTSTIMDTIDVME